MSRNATPSAPTLPVNAFNLLSFPGSTMLVCALAGLALAGCQKQEAAAKKLPIMVRAETVRIADYAPRTSLTGVIAARTLNNLSFRVGGRIAERLVDVGQHVDKDAVLARIDPQEQESDLRSAQANLDAAQAQLT
ncbi:MAG: biotin/lipoyl-binding protein, partial [Mesorhizobium sp.]